MVEEKKPEKKEQKPKFEVGNVVTNTSSVILKDGGTMTELEALVEILNRLDKLEKAI